jgi:5'-3' exonuclease
MGIPTFFLKILTNKYYKNIHSGVKNGKIECDYFFLDYNGIVYSAYEKIKKDIEGKNLSKNDIEDLVINEVVRYTKYLICDVVKPKVLTYIAFDGPAPRAKMVQQRSRRFKTYQEKINYQIEKKRLNIYNDEIEWDRSANISPGTEFMQKLSNKLIKLISSKEFNSHDKNMKVLLSDSNVPGEGEHKFLPTIRDMRKNKKYVNSKVYFYGKDADLIVLAISTHKNNIRVIREVQVETREMKNMYQDYEFIDVNIDNLRNAFNNDLTRFFKNYSFDKIRILNDYIFLTFLVGNDFVLSMPFLKIKNDGLETLIAIYHQLKMKHNDYLIDYHPDLNNSPKVNLLFFKELIYEVSKKEDFFMKRQQQLMNKLMNGFRKFDSLEKEKNMTPFEIFHSRYLHLEVCSPDHPLFEKYHNEFKKINYNQDYEVWKEEYYNYYLKINKNDLEEYNNIINDIVTNYLESLMFSLKYYFQGCPSWQWHYKFRISPLLSDIYNFLEKEISNMNEFEFKLGAPYTPFQQLMLILPPQLNNLVPSVLRPIMIDDKLLCTQFYPTDFTIDVTIGIKTQYSEPILPEIDEELLLSVVKKCELKLSPEEKIRNTILDKPKMS